MPHYGRIESNLSYCPLHSCGLSANTFGPDLQRFAREAINAEQDLSRRFVLPIETLSDQNLRIVSGPPGQRYMELCVLFH